MADEMRVLFLVLIILILVIGRVTGRLSGIFEWWDSVDLFVRLLLVILVGWPVIGYVTPVLIAGWEFLSQSFVGLGGSYLVTDRTSQLLTVLIAITTVQTTIIILKIQAIEEKI
jgi:hypothetical protein